MNLRKPVLVVARVASVLLVIVAVSWSVHWLWQTVAGNLPQGGLAQQMMHRKSRTMADILDGMIHEDFPQLYREAKRMASYNTTIERFLRFPEYERQSDEFKQSLEDLIVAAKGEDSDSSKEAVLRLERSCIECHVLLNQRNRSNIEQQNTSDTQKPSDK